MTLSATIPCPASTNLKPLRSWNGYDLFFVDKNGVNNSAFPGFENLPAGTYLSINIDLNKKIFLISFQGNRDIVLKDGRIISSADTFSRRQGHAQVRDTAKKWAASATERNQFVNRIANIDDSGTGYVFLGGGVIIRGGDEIRDHLVTKTRGINGESTTLLPSSFEAFPNANTARRVLNGGRRDSDKVNGLLRARFASKLGLIAANVLGRDLYMNTYDDLREEPQVPAGSSSSFSRADVIDRTTKRWRDEKKALASGEELVEGPDAYWRFSPEDSELVGDNFSNCKSLI